MAHAASANETGNKKGASTFYHHTDKESAKKILESGHIKQSTDTKIDAVFGKGTYLTTLGPSEPKEKIAQNNYDGKTSSVWENKLGQTDVVLEVKTTAEKCPEPDRDVYKHDGDIPVKDIQKVHVRDEKGGVKTYTLKKKKHFIKKMDIMSFQNY